MFYIPRKNDDHLNCKEHRWPRTNPGVSARSIGTVTYMQCNNCLAFKFNWVSTVPDGNGGWIEVTDEKIVEPNYG